MQMVGWEDVIGCWDEEEEQDEEEVDDFTVLDPVAGISSSDRPIPVVSVGAFVAAQQAANEAGSRLQGPQVSRTFIPLKY